MNDATIPAAIAYITDLFRGNFGGHDAAHPLRVYSNALLIAEGEPSCDTEIVALAALLHDADDHKLFRTENNANARSFLTAQKVAPEKIERICEAINAVSFSQNRGRRPQTLEGQIDRTRIVWMRWAPSALPARLPTAANTGARWMNPSRIFTKSCCF